MALQSLPRQQVHIPATVPTQDPAQLGMTLLVNETLAATRRRTLNHFAFMNLVPYRTLDNLTPPRKAWKVGWRELVEPSLKELAPVAIFALGAPPRDALQKWGAAQTSPVFYLKRLRGDGGVSPAARAVLDLVQSVEWGEPPTTRPRLVRPALVRGCGQAYALQTVEPVTYRCGTRRVCQARSCGSERDTRARPHAVAPMNCVPEDSRRRSTCTGRTHSPRARADGHQTPSSTVAVRAPSPS